MKLGTLFGILLMSLIVSGLTAGILPMWISILPLFVFLLYEAGRIFRGSGLDASVANATTGITLERTVSSWTSYLYQNELNREIPKANWNCKNCGGPNIQQVKCEWCGMVKE